MPYQQLADAVLIGHFAIALFVVAGLPLIVIGNVLGLTWINAMSFRLAHLAAIAVVVAESALGLPCPLTTLESWLRTQAGQARYSRGFIEHWLQYLLFYEAPPWAFGIAYGVFGLLVVAAWWYFPPKARTPRRRHA